MLSLELFIFVKERSCGSARTGVIIFHCFWIEIVMVNAIYCNSDPDVRDRTLKKNNKVQATFCNVFNSN